MRLKFFALAALAAEIGIPTLPAQNSKEPREAGQTRMLSIQDCIRLALEHNLDIQIQSYAPKISHFNLKAAYGVWDPVFSATGSHSFLVQGSSLSTQNLVIPPGTTDANTFTTGLSGDTPSGLTYNLSSSIGERYGQLNGAPFRSSSGSYGAATLSQPLLKNLWVDANRLNIAVNKTQLRLNELTLRQQIITTVTSVKQAYYDLVADEMNVDVNQEAVKLAQQLLDNNRAQLQAGTLSPLDLKQAQSQLATSKAALLAAKAAAATQQNLVKSLLTDNYSAWAEIAVHPSDHLLAVPVSPDLHESWRDGAAKRPDLLQAKVNLEKIGLQLKYDKNQLFPDLELTGGYMFNGSSTLANGNGQFSDVFNNFESGNRPSYSYGATLTFPLANTAARNTRKADKMTREQLILQFKKTRDTALTAIQNDVKNIESNLEQVQATREAEDYANQALAAEQQKLAAGTSTIFNVIQLQNNLTTARFAAIQALDSYNKTVDQLAADTGTTIEKNHIVLEAR